jgi:thiamine kinase-like enzyme
LQQKHLFFLHHDLHNSQGIVNLTDQGVVLIDFERWCIGDPISDIAIYLYHLIRQNQPNWCFEKFLNGYKNRNPQIIIRESFLKYLLLFNSVRAVYLFNDWPLWRERSTITHQKVLEYLNSGQLNFPHIQRDC